MIKNNDMVYNEKTRRYRLTNEYVLNQLGTDLNSVLYDEFDTNTGTLAERTLKYVSDMVYDYLLMHSADYNYVCELIETSERVNELFKNALGYQLFYFLQVGDLALDTKVNNDVILSRRTFQVISGLNLLTIQKKPSVKFYGYGDIIC